MEIGDIIVAALIEFAIVAIAVIIICAAIGIPFGAALLISIGLFMLRGLL